ncbi:MAG: polysaccharide biosynthesis protein [Sphingomonadales bacterium]|nr:polysaccharide biosynthesis protein [Sphingomonadales bacterium]
MSSSFAQRFAQLLLELPRVQKRIIAIVIDILLCLFTVALAYRLRLDAWIYPIGNQWLSYIAAIAIAIPLFIRFGLYRAIFRYIGWYALSAVTLACAIYGAVYSLIFSVIGIDLIPRTTGFLQPILLFVGAGASRAVARFWLGGGYAAILGKSTKRRVLVYGAGSAGRQLAGGLANSQEMLVVAFVDDDPKLHGNHLNGKLIYSPLRMQKVIEDLAIEDVLLAIPSASRKRINEIVDSLQGHGVTVRTLPGIFELADGKVTVSDLRPIQIEDLLGRDAVPPDQNLMAKCILGKPVLVTGAGGSIGSELCRQILRQRPSQLILVDNSEYNLYAIDQELTAQSPAGAMPPVIVPILASVTDAQRLDEIFSRFTPETVYHAAAYKHVPMVESNPEEGIKNNIFGTKMVAEAALAHGVSDFVLISTDKAVRPPNIMGASKRIAEMLLQAMAVDCPTTRFSMVRFGNVLGSSGSVVPLFRQQIAKSGPVTLTHPEVTRYFMTIPEAAQLVIQAGAMASGGEVFILDMGQPVRIIDLARRMIQLSGLSVKDDAESDGDIEIQIVGLRPGEKLYEELLIGNDPQTTAHQRIMKANEVFIPLKELEKHLSLMTGSNKLTKLQEIQKWIAVIVPEFCGRADAPIE